MDQADDQPGEHCTEQGRERRAGEALSELGMKDFRNGLQKSRYTLQNRFNFLRRRH